ncbi:hypothetical protein ABBQ32_013163 [Trebouxia sp. C0010 RCD-2024]
MHPCLSAREARHPYNGLKQNGSVMEFVREQIQLVHELEDTPFHPGGSVFDDFIRGLKSDVQTFVQDHTPSGWWTEIKDLYQKALDFEMKGIASSRARVRARSPEQLLRLENGNVVPSAQKRSGRAGNGNGNVSGVVVVVAMAAASVGGAAMMLTPRARDLGAMVVVMLVLEAVGGGGGGVYITPEEMKARYMAGFCQFCASPNHQRKDCNAPKSMQPSFAQRRSVVPPLTPLGKRRLHAFGCIAVLALVVGASTKLADSSHVSGFLIEISF